MKTLKQRNRDIDMTIVVLVVLGLCVLLSDLFKDVSKIPFGLLLFAIIVSGIFILDYRRHKINRKN